MCLERVNRGLACATVAQRIRRGTNLWSWLINLAEESDTITRYNRTHASLNHAITTIQFWALYVH